MKYDKHIEIMEMSKNFLWDGAYHCNRDDHQKVCFAVSNAEEYL